MKHLNDILNDDVKGGLFGDEPKCCEHGMSLYEDCTRCMKEYIDQQKERSKSKASCADVDPWDEYADCECKRNEK